MEFLMFMLNIIVSILAGGWLFHLIEKYIYNIK